MAANPVPIDPVGVLAGPLSTTIAVSPVLTFTLYAGATDVNPSPMAGSGLGLVSIYVTDEYDIIL